MNDLVLFIGDSITEGFDISKHLPELNIQNKGISGLSTLDLLEIMDGSWFDNYTKYIFLCKGTNDLARGFTNEQIINHIKQIVGRIFEFAWDTELVINSVFPTRDNESRPNERIIKLNESLIDLSKKYNLKYFDLISHFIDDSGKLKSEFTDDGLHLTEQAYIYWTKLFKDYLTNLIKK